MIEVKTTPEVELNIDTTQPLLRIADSSDSLTPSVINSAVGTTYESSDPRSTLLRPFTHPSIYLWQGNLKRWDA
ncbi:hypothetical protein NMY22_g18714 [Coprinellus aureogranulatus]|nr:hypothetical protein NMY22_g18714 [Coprinellus aureogranulatus]